jgi:protein SCO1
MKMKWLFALLAAFSIGVALDLYQSRFYSQETANIKPLESNSADTKTLPSIKIYGDNNQELDLFDRSDSRIRIVYFGFTRCPDVCPTSLAMLAGALNQLDESTISQLRPVFISLDPERDKASDTAQYAHYFHPNIEGGSASLSDTIKLSKHYGVIFKKTQLVDSQLDYTLDHSSYFYFLTPDGQLLEKVPHTLSPKPIVDMIRLITSSEGQ